jgi:hypothetical protein
MNRYDSRSSRLANLHLWTPSECAGGCRKMIPVSVKARQPRCILHASALLIWGWLWILQLLKLILWHSTLTSHSVTFIIFLWSPLSTLYLSLSHIWRLILIHALSITTCLGFVVS